LNRYSRGVGFVNEHAESGIVAGGDIGKHLAIQIDAGPLQTAPDDRSQEDTTLPSW